MASSCGWAATSAAAASRRRRASPRPGARSAPATTRRSRAASTTGTSPSTARSRLEKEEWPPSAPSAPVTSSAVLPETVDAARPPTDATSAASSSFRSGRARKPMKTTARPSPAENGPAAASDDDRGDGAFGGRGRFAADGRTASAGRLSRAASARRASASRARRRRSSFSTQPAQPRPARAISALRSLTLISSTRLAPLAGGASSSDDAARSMTGDALRGRGLVPAVFRSSTAGALRSSLSSSSDDESSRPFLRAAAGGAAAGASSSSELESSRPPMRFLLSMDPRQ